MANPNHLRIVPNPTEGDPGPDSPAVSTFGGGGPTFVGMDVIDAKIEAAEARTDTKFAQVIGELGKIGTRLDHVESGMRDTRDSVSALKSAMIVTAVGSVLAIAGLFYAALQNGNGMFGTGLNVQAISDHSAQNAIAQTQPKFDAIDAQFTDLNKKIGTLIDAFQKTQPQPKQ